MFNFLTLIPHWFMENTKAAYNKLIIKYLIFELNPTFICDMGN